MEVLDRRRHTNHGVVVLRNNQDVSIIIEEGAKLALIYWVVENTRRNLLQQMSVFLTEEMHAEMQWNYRLSPDFADYISEQGTAAHRLDGRNRSSNRNAMGDVKSMR